MQKTYIVALLLISVCVSKEFDGYFITYDKSGSMGFKKENQQYDQQDLTSLFKANFQTLENKPTEQTARLIQKFGKGNLLKPLQMNYMFIVEGLSSEAAKNSQISSSVPVTFELNRNEKSSLVDDIFDESKPDSVVSNVNRFFATNETRSPFFIYSSEVAMSKYFKSFGLTVNVRKNNAVDVIDIASGKAYRAAPSMEQSFNDIFGKTYRMRGSEGFIYKINSFSKFAITPSNVQDVTLFLKDICAINKLSKLMKKGEQPNFALFYINSIAKLEKSLNKEDFAFIMEIFKSFQKKVSRNFANKFGELHVIGQVLFIDESDSSYLIANEKTGAITPKVILAEMKKTDIKQRRRLNEAAPKHKSSFDAHSYQIFVWLAVFLGFVLYYVCTSLYTMDVGKDSLLYAKFIATDAH